MQTFLRETAEKLYAQYGDGISSLHILFPSRRARLFFNDALAEIAGKPLWQPHYRSIDEVMEAVSGIRKSDPIRLVAELFNIYSGYHPEPFDKFYAWGEMLLSDFDQIDKYRIDAATLFINIADLKNLESDLSYLTEEQLAIIRQFWRNFDVENLNSPEKKHFVGIWNSLLPIYTGFRERLQQIGLAYPGMIYRTAAEKLLSDRQPENLSGNMPAADRPEELEQLLSHRYAIIGFNALSETEKILFDYLERHKAARFFWDYDTYYTDRREQEAGLFLRENIRRFPAEKGSAVPAHFLKPKEIVSVAAPSDAMQAKYVTAFLETIPDADQETAIVLTDENLLLPVLYSIPAAVGKINITMGYPLRQTPAYAFLERLIELQLHQKTRGNHTVFYHSDVTGLLNQPYLQGPHAAKSSEWVKEINERKQIYIPASKFSGDELPGSIFSPVSGWEALCEYLMRVLESVGQHLPKEETADMQPEFFTLIIDKIYQLENTLKGCGIEITDKMLFSLLRKMLQTVRIPYEGEPLEGIQVMGILETRNLDFKNVLVLSVNDDTFPGNLSASSSFVPYNLRLAYGLPTPQHHEGVYSYYFYRLIQRAERVHLVYSVKTDDKKTGEPSRYIYQLDYESPHEVTRREIALNINFPVKPDLTVPKDDNMLALLSEFTEGRGTRKISPSLFYSYVECPLKFYYQAIARLREEEEISEEVDLPLFGNIFHKAAELIYEGVKGHDDTDQRIQNIIGTATVDKAVEQAVILEYFKEEKNSSAEAFGGNLTLVADIVKKYLNTCLLAYDARNGEFRVKAVERWVDSTLAIPVNGQQTTVRLGGKIDRLDRLDDDTLRVVDYKTGGRKSEFKGIDSLFSPLYADRNPAALQTMLYSWMLHKETGHEIVPSLYYIRFMHQPDYTPLLTEILTDETGKRKGSCEAACFSDYAESLTEQLTRKLAEIFDRNTPFSPCDDLKTCEYCPYREVCNR